MEKDINELYRQNELLKTGPGGIYEISHLFELAKKDFDTFAYQR